MTENPPPEPDFEADHTEARRAAADAVRRLERAAYDRGLHEGFHAGWEAGVNHLREMMQRSATPPTSAAPAQHAEPTNFFALIDTDVPLPSKAADTVLEVIEARPGIRGVDIVKVTEQVGKPIRERTVRTALHRMKREGRITNLGGRWYIAEAAPEQGQQSDGDADD